MATNKDQKYFAKVLLAGEYLVLDGSMALAIPLSNYRGYWKYTDKIDTELSLLSNYLEKTSCNIEVNRFKQDIQNGLSFYSTIPRGYGIGSSGALVAAIYDEYNIQKLSDESIIKEVINIESYYHGNSSGIDPAVSYYNCGIIIKNGSFSKVKTPSIKNIYLYDSKFTRTTDKLVQEYKKRHASIQYQNIFKELKTLNENLIHLILEENNQLREIWKKISALQLEIFDFAIPKEVKEKWTSEYEKGNFFKLCGAGGGGFYLVYSENNISDYTPIFNLQ